MITLLEVYYTHSGKQQYYRPTHSVNIEADMYITGDVVNRDALVGLLIQARGLNVYIIAMTDRAETHTYSTM